MELQGRSSEHVIYFMMSIDVYNIFQGRRRDQCVQRPNTKCKTDKEFIVVFPLYCSPACYAATRPGAVNVAYWQREAQTLAVMLMHSIEAGRWMWFAYSLLEGSNSVGGINFRKGSIFLVLSILYISLPLFLSEVIQKRKSQIVLGSDKVPDTILEPQQLWWWHGA